MPKSKAKSHNQNLPKNLPANGTRQNSTEPINVFETCCWQCCWELSQTLYPQLAASLLPTRSLTSSTLLVYLSPNVLKPCSSLGTWLVSLSGNRKYCTPLSFLLSVNRFSYGLHWSTSHLALTFALLFTSSYFGLPSSYTLTCSQLDQNVSTCLRFISLSLLLPNCI